MVVLFVTMDTLNTRGVLYSTPPGIRYQRAQVLPVAVLHTTEQRLHEESCLFTETPMFGEDVPNVSVRLQMSPLLPLAALVLLAPVSPLSIASDPAAAPEMKQAPEPAPSVMRDRCCSYQTIPIG